MTTRRRRRLGPGLVALVALLGLSGADSRLLLCDAAADRLALCCGFDPSRIDCSSSGCDSIGPSFAEDEARCIVEADCDALRERACPLLPPSGPLPPLSSGRVQDGGPLRTLLCGPRS